MNNFIFDKDAPEGAIREITKSLNQLHYIEIHSVWNSYVHDIPAKTMQGHIGSWLLTNVGEMGMASLLSSEWKDSQTWCWSLLNGRFDLPFGVYFRNREDATRFVLTFPDFARSSGNTP